MEVVLVLSPVELAVPSMSRKKVRPRMTRPIPLSQSLTIKYNLFSSRPIWLVQSPVTPKTQQDIICHFGTSFIFWHEIQLVHMFQKYFRFHFVISQFTPDY